MRLYMTALHFMGDDGTDMEFDYCVHGKVTLEVGGCILSDGSEDWCVSASAYCFLKSIFTDHKIDTEEQMIPCCGHTFIPSEDKSTVTVVGCPDGIDFSVIEKNDRKVIITRDGKEHSVSIGEYAASVMEYAAQIEEFYLQNPPREFESGLDRDGFAAFCNEWHALTKKARELMGETGEGRKIDLDDSVSYTEDDIAGFTADGIALKNMRFIDFEECAANFKSIYGGDGKCVGEREIGDVGPCFTFYTSPNPTNIFLLPRGRLRELFSKWNTPRRFFEMCEQIGEMGYSTYDMS